MSKKEGGREREGGEGEREREGEKGGRERGREKRERGGRERGERERGGRERGERERGGREGEGGERQLVYYSRLTCENTPPYNCFMILYVLTNYVSTYNTPSYSASTGIYTRVMINVWHYTAATS